MGDEKKNSGSENDEIKSDDGAVGIFFAIEEVRSEVNEDENCNKLESIGRVFRVSGPEVGEEGGEGEEDSVNKESGRHRTSIG